MADVKPYWLNYIDGAWICGGAGGIDVIAPATGARIAEHALTDSANVDRAARASRRVHLSGELMAMRPIERGRMVQAMGRYLIEHWDEIARVLTLEQNKTLWESRIEVEGAALCFEYYGNQASTVEGRSIPLGAGHMDWTEYEPCGVSAQIIPWNYPVEMTARSLSAALATGNACVIKSPEMTPLTNAYLVKAAEAAGFPAGAVNVFCGLGRDAGAALAAHRDVNQIVFTGSVSTGIAIAMAAAQNVVPCLLVLGGKSAAIVHESRHDELIERAEKVAKSQSVGPGSARTEFDANMGAMASEGQCDRAAGKIARAEEKGTRVAAGGRKLDRPGVFLEPTVLAGVAPDMDIATQDGFGPVLSGMPFRDDAQAIDITNGTDYGLVAGAFIADLDRAAWQLRAGQVFVNEWYAGGVETPVGGCGKSGYGREKGREALWN